MHIETWFVLSVAAAFLLLGIAVSPLAWVALLHRKSRLETLFEKRWSELTARAAPARGPARPGGSTRDARRQGKARACSLGSKRVERARFSQSSISFELASPCRDARRARRGRVDHLGSESGGGTGGARVAGELA